MDKELSITPATVHRSSDEVIFTDTVFGFWDEFQDSSENSSKSSKDAEIDDDEEEEDNDSICTMEKSKAFWEEQDQLLKATLCRSSSCETKVRQATKEAMKELNMSEMLCMCRRPVVAATSCRNCLLREICDRLLNFGFNSAICKSKWRSSSEISSGEHTYLEVIENSTNTKRGMIKVVIELNFRGEFEMARGNEEYNKLVNKLPELFVGKSERLRTLVKIMCSCAKKCMKEKKLHLGPWRKQKYMLAKWDGKKCDKSLLEPLPIVYYSTSQTKPKASMLTCDLLLENIVGRNYSALQVI